MSAPATTAGSGPAGPDDQVPDENRPDGASLLDAWDHACAVPAVARGAVLAYRLGLQADAAGATLATTAASMIELHRRFFGPRVEMIMNCPVCDEVLELDLELATCARFPAADRREVRTAAGRVLVRAPIIADLLAVEDRPDPADALLERLVIDGAAAGPGLSGGDRDLIDEVAQDLAGAAGTVLSVRCPGCETVGRAGFDPTDHVWERVDRWAMDQLASVAVLARAYGWSEREVLALSPARRARYLELAQA